MRLSLCIRITFTQYAIYLTYQDKIFALEKNKIRNAVIIYGAQENLSRSLPVTKFSYPRDNIS